jgi:hypothetical protein
MKNLPGSDAVECDAIDTDGGPIYCSVISRMKLSDCCCAFVRPPPRQAKFTDEICHLFEKNNLAVRPAFGGKTSIVPMSERADRSKQNARTVTELLRSWCQGDASALTELTPVVHEELHRLARRQMRNERADHTLQTTAGVNEAYLKLIDLARVRTRMRSMSRRRPSCVTGSSQRSGCCVIWPAESDDER